MATRQISTRAQLRQEQIQFIRAQTLALTVSDSRPNTRLYVFFGGVDVSSMCHIDSATPGAPIFTDMIGNAAFKFDLPGGTFNTGEQEIVVSEVQNLQLLDTNGNTFGQARGKFNSRGTMEIWQTTNTTIVTVERIIQQATSDPIAQSFFTYGITGGAFLSQIDLFFQTRDETLPVTVEIRTMTNGYPTQDANVSSRMKSTLAAAKIATSMDASAPSKFMFNPPIYLTEGADFCFVVRSNSNKYNMFTSKMGEKSIEDSRTIFEQPYVGTLFRSENSITWQAEQFEDVKFTLNRAVFDPSSLQEVVLRAEIPHQITQLKNFQTIQGSNLVRYTHAADHGLRVGDSFEVQVESGFNFNGIPSQEFNGINVVVQTPNSYSIEFNTNTNAAQSGAVNSGGKLAAVGVNRSGDNYSVGDQLTFTGGGGTGAAGYMILAAGKISSVVITNAGSGYTSEPIIQINTQTGNGGVLYTQVQPGCSILLNKPLSSFSALIYNQTFGSSRIETTINTTTEQYQNGEQFDIKPGAFYKMQAPSLIANTKNETIFMSGANQFDLTMRLETDADNVSPIIDTTQQMYLTSFYNKINDQPGEDLDSDNESGSLQSVTITNAGSGYVGLPTIFVSPPELVGGVQAVVTVGLTGGVITSVVITEPGIGYLSAPQIVVIPAQGDNIGAGGALQAEIQTFNTELSAQNGRADSRYLTKQINLEMPSTGLRLYSVISSVPTTSVEWYARVQMNIGKETHDKLSWIKMQCDVERSRSKFIGEVYEYEFKIDDLAEFDTYDLKCVLRAKQSVQIPYVKSYRVIAIA